MSVLQEGIASCTPQEGNVEGKPERKKASVKKGFELCYHPAYSTLFFFLLRIHRHGSLFVQPLPGDWQNLSFWKEVVSEINKASV